MATPSVGMVPVRAVSSVGGEEMVGTPPWVRRLGVGIALAVMALLLAAVAAVPLRSLTAPEKGTEGRLHLNTKLTTRLAGADAGQVAASVARAVYPATSAQTAPDLVIAYPPDDWRAGLAAASLIKPLNAVLIPATEDLPDLLAQLRPRGSGALDGARILAVGDGVSAPDGVPSRRVGAGDLPRLRLSVAPAPARAVIVSADDPGTALLAAPWAGYSGDLVVFDQAQAPSGLPRYGLGPVEVDEDRLINEQGPDRTSVAFAAFFAADSGFGWNINGSTSPTGYRGFVLANRDQPATAVLAANLARRGKPGPLLWSQRQTLPQPVNDFLSSQRPAFWTVPNEGPFDHVYVLGDTNAVSFAAQSQADYALEIGPYRMKGPGAAGMDMLAAAWLLLGFASALWIAVHQTRHLRGQQWVMRLAWPLWAIMAGPLAILTYWLAYRRPVIRHGQMTMWDRPLWLQGVVATVSAVGFGGTLMITTAWSMTFFGLPLLPNHLPGGLMLLGSPMIWAMIGAYLVAVGVSWLLFQTPMIAMFHGRPYRRAPWTALPVVLASMTSVSVVMFPGMWWLMMANLPMMPSEESILWFGVMAWTVVGGSLIAWPTNYALVRARRKSGLM